jgi:hypothetical protein
VRSSPAKTTADIHRRTAPDQATAGAVFLPGRFIFAEFGKGGKFGRSPNAAEMPPRRENAVGRKFAQSDFSGGIAIDFTGRRCYNLLVFKITTMARLLHGIVVLILPQNGLCFFGYEKYYLMQEVPR